MPENLKYFLIYLNSALKTQALRIMSGNSKIDFILYWIYKHLAMSPLRNSFFLYPRIYDVTDIGQPDCQYGFTLEGTQLIAKPDCLIAKSESIDPSRVYLIDNGEYLFLYIGKSLDDQTVYNLFGYDSYYSFSASHNQATHFYPVES